MKKKINLKNHSFFHSDQPDQEKAEDKCTHWSRSTQTCSLVQNGLFLPSVEHIVTYCETPYFSSCGYFQQADFFSSVNSKVDKEKHGRRLYPREVFREKILFSEISENEPVGKYPEELAQAVDLSAGGMCLETGKEIAVNTELAFFLEKQAVNFPAQGRVVWSRRVGQDEKYLCGVAFQGVD